MFTFIESSIFERVCPAYLDDDEYSELQQFLMQTRMSGMLFLAQVAFANYDGHELGWESEEDSASSTMYGISPMSLDANTLCEGEE